MRSLLLFFIASIFVMPVFASENPNLNQLTQLVCYGVRQSNPATVDQSLIIDDPNISNNGLTVATRDPNFTIIVRQNHTDDYDASFFIPGNENYSSVDFLPGRTDFTVKVYKNTQIFSSATDHKQLATELLENKATHSYEASGTRSTRNRIFMSWDDDLSVVQHIPDNPSASNYSDDSTFDFRSIYCETAYGVTDPNTAPSQASPSQSAEVIGDQSGVKAEL